MFKKTFLKRTLAFVSVIGIGVMVVLFLLVKHRTHRNGIDGILVNYGTQYFIYWIRGTKNIGVSTLTHSNWRPVGWTPSGKFLIWLGQGHGEDEKDVMIGVSDPCGQVKPQLVVDLSAYPEWKLSPAGIHWLDDNVLLLNMEPKRYQPDQPCCSIWRMDVGSQKLLSEWKVLYSVIRVLSSQVLVLWNGSAGEDVFWTSRDTFPLPRSWENSFFSMGSLSPDGQWLAWEGDDSIFVGPFAPHQGVLSEKKVAPSLHFRLLGWQREPLKLLLLQTEGEERYTFWAFDPQTGKHSRLRTLHVAPRVSFAGSGPFLVGPDAQRVMAVWFDGRDNGSPWWAYVDIWDLQTGEKVTLVKKEQSIAVPLDWKRIDMRLCPESLSH